RYRHHQLVGRGADDGGLHAVEADLVVFRHRVEVGAEEGDHAPHGAAFRAEAADKRRVLGRAGREEGGAGDAAAGGGGHGDRAGAHGGAGDLGHDLIVAPADDGRGGLAVEADHAGGGSGAEAAPHDGDLGAALSAHGSEGGDEGRSAAGAARVAAGLDIPGGGHGAVRIQ